MINTSDKPCKENTDNVKVHGTNLGFLREGIPAVPKIIDKEMIKQVRNEGQAHLIESLMNADEAFRKVSGLLSDLAEKNEDHINRAMEIYKLKVMEREREYKGDDNHPLRKTVAEISAAKNLNAEVKSAKLMAEEYEKTIKFLDSLIPQPTTTP